MHALVTGGGGFLGSGIAKALIEKGDTVTVIGRRKYSHLPPSVKIVQGDIRDYEFLKKSSKNIDVVFHTAALPGIWGPAHEFFSINVKGTENIISACRENSIPKLVFTSSPSVVFGKSSLEGVDESTPYPNKYLCEYPRTKALAEKMVLEANDTTLCTVAIRPHLIWGPGDPHLVPRLLQKAKNKRLMRVGEGKNQVDMIYIDNAVSAHLKAALAPNANVAGKAYFVSDDEPVILWNWINELLNRLRIPEVSRNISYSNALRLGTILEGVYGFLGIKKEPPMTRFLASQLATSHYFNISRAKKDFGYQPLVTQEEGINRLIHSLNSPPQEY
ncbi:MAG: NAD-dependent epimerase/dehydratase family protein [Nitrospinae bacterium]|nr:NAD-dependent epimerase/dehydratase family protein [Nitrospinota bacterium]